MPDPNPPYKGNLLLAIPNARCGWSETYWINQGSFAASEAILKELADVRLTSTASLRPHRRLSRHEPDCAKSCLHAPVQQARHLQRRRRAALLVRDPVADQQQRPFLERLPQRSASPEQRRGIPAFRGVAEGIREYVAAIAQKLRPRQTEAR